MENPFVDFPISSLKQRAVINVTIELWKQLDIRNEAKDSFVSCSGYTMYRDWEKIERKVSENATQLSLPHTIKQEILAAVKAMGRRIVDWMILMKYKQYCTYYVESSQCPSIDFINHFCWTSQGTIDEQKTIKLFLENQSLTVKYRYELACIFCCENYVPVLRNHLSDRAKKQFDISSKGTLYDSSRLYDFWACYMNEDTTRLISVIREEAPNDGLFEHMFKWSIKHDNHVAALYFWQKLTLSEKNDGVVGFAADAMKHYQTDILWFLLRQMDNVQREQVFEDRPYELLKLIYQSLLYQDFFLSVANCTWRFLSSYDYFDLLIIIIKGESQKVLAEFWIESPHHLKKGIITHQCIWKLLTLLEIKGKTSIIKLILNSANANEKKQIALSKKGKDEFLKLILHDEWVFLKVFIESFFVSDEEINDFKSTLIASNACWLDCRVERWQLVEEFLNWRCSSDDKIKEFKQKITHESGDGLCIHLIRNEEWGLVDKYLNWRFCTLEEIRYFKQCVSQTGGKGLCASLICKNNWEQVEKFLDWCDFSSSEEINNFKRELARSEGIHVCHTLLIESHWDLVERFLVWCCFSSEQETSNFKKEICKVNGYDICISFATRVNLQSADQFVNWCFSSREEINNFKRELACSRGIEVVYEFSDQSLQSIDEFLNWCFSSQQEINQFKREIIQSEEKIDICIKFMHEDKFQLAETFVNWCFQSELEVHRFKRELLFSDDNIELVVRFIDGEVYNRNKRLLWIEAGESNQWGLVYRLINWYAQPKEVIAEFKNIKFGRSWLSNSTESEFDDKLTVFFDILDEFVLGMTVEENAEKEAVNT